MIVMKHKVLDTQKAKLFMALQFTLANQSSSAAARRIGADRAYISRMRRGKLHPSLDWLIFALLKLGHDIDIVIR